MNDAWLLYIVLDLLDKFDKIECILNVLPGHKF